jgi:hypothetical protein
MVHNTILRVKTRLLLAVVDDDGMSTAEYLTV